MQFERWKVNWDVLIPNVLEKTRCREINTRSIKHPNDTVLSLWNVNKIPLILKSTDT